MVKEVRLPENFAFQAAAYLQNEQKLGPLTLRYGLRFASFNTLGPTDQKYFDPVTHELTKTVPVEKGKVIRRFSGLEPRISASLPLGDSFSLKGAWVRSFQYLQQSRISITGSPVDAWFTASPNVEPQRSDQYSLGVNALLSGEALQLSLEGFYKDNRNTMDFVDNPGLVLADPDREGLLRFGTSWSFGTELMLKYDFARWNGWLSYTWSRSWYHIPELNGGKPYPSPLNHEHAVNFVLTKGRLHGMGFLQRVAHHLSRGPLQLQGPLGPRLFQPQRGPVAGLSPDGPFPDLAHPAPDRRKALGHRMEPVALQRVFAPQRLVHRLYL